MSESDIVKDSLVESSENLGRLDQGLSEFTFELAEANEQIFWLVSTIFGPPRGLSTFPELEIVLLSDRLKGWSCPA